MQKRIIDYDYVLDSLNKLRPGFGLETNGKGPMDLPMAYGLVASASAMRKDVQTARLAANWLVENPASECKPGWGLGWAYDAFRDGSINPADTVYGITTALAVDGLIRTYKLVDDKRFLTFAVKALEYYVNYINLRGTSLTFWYSDQLQDKLYNAYNVTSMLMGQYATVGCLTGNNDFLKIAEGALNNLKTNVKEEQNYCYWHYAGGIKRVSPNCLVHASYIVYGLWKYVSSMKRSYNLLEQAGKYLDGFVTDSGVLEFHPHHVPRGIKGRRARSWGLGMLLFISTLLENEKMREKILTFLPEYEFSKQRFSYQYGDKLHSPRSVAYLLLGLAPSSVC